MDWTLPRRQKLRDWWHEGVPVKEIARRFGKARSTVSVRAGIEGLPKRKTHIATTLLKSRNTLIREEYAEGNTSIRILAGEYGMSRAGLHKILNPASYVEKKK